MLFTGLGSVRAVRYCSFGLENAAVGGLGQNFEDPRHSFSLYEPPSRQIAYIYFFINVPSKSIILFYIAS